MKFSAKLEYALLALLYLKCEPDESPVSGRQLSEKLCIPYRFLEQILSDLKKSGLVRSVRGYQGGYQLNAEPDNISIYDIFKVTEGNFEPWDCANSMERCHTSDNKCVISHFYADFKQTLIKLMQSYTLQKLCITAQALKKQGSDQPEKEIISSIKKTVIN
tara:strand:+ start:208 stop:690 length:483 start_codon:yes stop_codon:yes gene_type:complete